MDSRPRKLSKPNSELEKEVSGQRKISVGKIHHERLSLIQASNSDKEDLACKEPSYPPPPPPAGKPPITPINLSRKPSINQPSISQPILSPVAHTYEVPLTPTRDTSNVELPKVSMIHLSRLPTSKTLSPQISSDFQQSKLPTTQALTSFQTIKSTPESTTLTPILTTDLTGLPLLDHYQSLNPSLKWYQRAPIAVPPHLLGQLGGIRPIGQPNSIDNYTPARYSKSYYTMEEQKASDRQFHPHTPEKQLFQFRCLVAAMITRVGWQLGLPSLTINRALHLFHRFYLFQGSAQHFLPKEFALGTLFLAGKEEDTQKKLHEVINVGLKVISTSFPGHNQTSTKEMINHTRARCLELEGNFLAVKCYQFQFSHPGYILISIIKLLNIPIGPAQLAWQLLNESYWFPLCLQYPGQVMACGSLLIAVKILDVDCCVSNISSWYNRFMVHEFDLYDFAYQLVSNCMSVDELIHSIATSQARIPHHSQGLIPTSLNKIAEPNQLIKLKDSLHDEREGSFKAETKPRLRPNELATMFDLTTDDRESGTRFKF